ncbi:vegetative protein [Myxococcus sp. RHSTA-1-4]|uniref:vegetative protein n=1 Tax=Myxococcus sp. RHSTA-1-4 TaxID=2874601 RepID=UPI00351CE8FD
MDESLEALEQLRSATYRLAPLTSRLGSMAGVRTASVIPEPAPARGPGRRKPPAGAALKKGRAAAAKKAPAPAPVKRARAEEGARACAIMGCKRPSRSKGYCSAHYQKLRLLMRTNRRPAEWVDDAKPQSVREVKLPRGRAASKALKEGARAQPAAPAVPPKPKAWVRKKGKSGMVSLH